jgi:hypothetical protein
MTWQASQLTSAQEYWKDTVSDHRQQWDEVVRTYLNLTLIERWVRNIHHKAS